MIASSGNKITKTIRETIWVFHSYASLEGIIDMVSGCTQSVTGYSHKCPLHLDMLGPSRGCKINEIGNLIRI